MTIYHFLEIDRCYADYLGTCWYIPVAFEVPIYAMYTVLIMMNHVSKGLIDLSTSTLLVPHTERKYIVIKCIHLNVILSCDNGREH